MAIGHAHIAIVAPEEHDAQSDHRQIVEQILLADPHGNEGLVQAEHAHGTPRCQEDVQAMEPPEVVMVFTLTLDGDTVADAGLHAGSQQIQDSCHRGVDIHVVVVFTQHCKADKCRYHNRAEHVAEHITDLVHEQACNTFLDVGQRLLVEIAKALVLRIIPLYDIVDDQVVDYRERQGNQAIQIEILEDDHHGKFDQLLHDGQHRRDVGHHITVLGGGQDGRFVGIQEIAQDRSRQEDHI